MSSFNLGKPKVIVRWSLKLVNDEKPNHQLYLQTLTPSFPIELAKDEHLEIEIDEYEI